MTAPKASHTTGLAYGSAEQDHLNYVVRDHVDLARRTGLGQAVKDRTFNPPAGKEVAADQEVKRIDRPAAGEVIGDPPAALARRFASA